MIAWLVAILVVLTLLDVITTHLALVLGAVELNPVAKALGFDWRVKILLALIYSATALLLCRLGGERTRLFVHLLTGLLDFMMAYVVALNMTTLYAVLRGGP